MQSFHMDLRTTFLRLDDTEIEFLNNTGQSRKFKYCEIDSAQIYKDSKYSLKNFALVYWTCWMAFALGLSLFMIGTDYILDILKNVRYWGILLSLGLLAFKPIYSMLPHGTFIDIKLQDEVVRIPITDIVQDERIHKLVNCLKTKLGIDKVRINT